MSDSILAAIPGSTNVSLPYDKVFIQTTPTVKLSPSAVPDGMTTFKNYVVEYHHACPHTKIVAIGYSSGAIIEMNDLCYGGDGVNTVQINPLLSPTATEPIVIASVMYGDETRNGLEPFNAGTCTSNYNGIAPRDASKCYPFSQSMISYCDLEDPDCCAGSGNDVAVHLSYPTTYDAAATKFVVEAFQKYPY